MLKKVLIITGLIFTGLNFGIISGVTPIFLLIGLIAFEDGLEAGIVAGFSTVAAVISGVLTYLYMYGRRREHEQCSPYALALAWSFVAGAVIAAVALFIYSAYEGYRI